MDDCGLMDLGFSGSIYTWINRRPSSAAIQERLYWVLSNLALQTLFPVHSIDHLDFCKSDHRPIDLIFPSRLLFAGLLGLVFDSLDIWLHHSDCVAPPNF